jgi:hypothetical protein
MGFFSPDLYHVYRLAIVVTPWRMIKPRSFKKHLKTGIYVRYQGELEDWRLSVLPI